MTEPAPGPPVASRGPTRPGRQPRHLDIVFGLTAVVSFGSWFYGFGVLVDPLARDGIGEGLTASTYGAIMLLAGVGALVAGRILDRGRGRWVFAAGAPAVAIGTVATVLVAETGRVWAFALAATLTGGLVGALGHYSLLHAAIVALHPTDRTRAVTVNTLWGAFASPVFLPAMGVLVERWSWQVAMLAANATVVVAFVTMALVLPDPPTGPPEPSAHGRGRGTGWRQMGWLLAIASGGGAATAILLLYQVPAMVDAGLALAFASTLAGARGVVQVAARVPLPPVLRRVGTGPVMLVSLGLLAGAALLLIRAGSVPMALAFIVVGGAAVGILTTVENLFVTDVLTTTTVGAALGAVSVARGIGGAFGPTLAGLATEWQGSRDLALVGVAVLSVLTALVVLAVMRRHPSAGPPSPSRSP